MKSSTGFHNSAQVYIFTLNSKLVSKEFFLKRKISIEPNFIHIS